MGRGLDYRRHKNKMKIKKKMKILKDIHLYEDEWFTDVNVGKLDKGKVHCSCELCRGSYKWERERKSQKLFESDKREIERFISKYNKEQK